MFTKKIGTIGKYKIILTQHAAQRTKQRNVDTIKVVGAILTFGTEKLTEYENNGHDILLKDIQNNCSIVFAVAKNVITIITVIDKSDVWIKNPDNTIVQEI